jgi:hypothetical protein
MLRVSIGSVIESVYLLYFIFCERPPSVSSIVNKGWCSLINLRNSTFTLDQSFALRKKFCFHLLIFPYVNLTLIIKKKNVWKCIGEKRYTESHQVSVKRLYTRSPIPCLHRQESGFCNRKKMLKKSHIKTIVVHKVKNNANFHGKYKTKKN